MFEVFATAIFAFALFGSVIFGGHDLARNILLLSLPRFAPPQTVEMPSFPSLSNISGIDLSAFQPQS